MSVKKVSLAIINQNHQWSGKSKVKASSDGRTLVENSSLTMTLDLPANKKARGTTDNGHAAAVESRRRPP